MTPEELARDYVDRQHHDAIVRALVESVQSLTAEVAQLRAKLRAREAPVGSEAIQVVEEIYALYPRKIGRPVAIRAIIKALKRTDAGILKQAVSAYAASMQGQEVQFIPHPATWFNQERFNDDEATWVRKQAGGHKLHELRLMREAKERLARDLENKFASQNCFGLQWEDQMKRREYNQLHAEMKQIDARIASVSV